MKKLNLIGRRFGKLKVISENIHKNGRSFWLCQCDCGNKNVSKGSELNTGKIKSCGCIQKEKFKKMITKHNLSNTRFYYIWANMLDRCYREKCIGYKNYGGRGIRVCKKWKNFKGFRDDMYLKYVRHCKKFGRKNTSIDRIDNNKGYFPKNCRWATRKEQTKNQNHITWKILKRNKKGQFLKK